MGEFFQNNVLPAIMAFVNTKAVRAIKDGMVYSMPLIIVGAVYLLLFQLPVESLANFVNSTGAVPFLAHGYTSTFQITAFISAIGIAYQWAKNDGFEPLSAGIISAAAFLILIPDVIAGAGVDGADVAGLDKTWLAGSTQIDELITAGKRFWKMVQDKTAPAPDGSKSAGETLAAMHKGGQQGTLVLDRPELVVAFERMTFMAKAEAEAKASKEKFKQQIMEAMGDYEVAEIGGNKVTWKTQAGRTTIDGKKLKSELPDIYEKYSKVGKPVRVFRA